MGIEFDGVKDFNDVTARIDRADKRVAEMAPKLVKRVALAVEATAKLFCPVDTSATVNSIGVDPSDDGLSAVIGPTTSYAPFLEYGTSKMAPYAFMGPALDRHSWELVSGAEQLGIDVLD